VGPEPVCDGDKAEDTEDEPIAESQSVRKKNTGKGGAGTPSLATGGKSRKPSKAKPTAEFPDLFAMFVDPEETAGPPASTRTTPGRGGTTGSRAPGGARSESGSGRRADHAGAGGVSETHSRLEGDALARQEPPPPAANILGEVTAAAKEGLKPTASGRARKGRVGRR
jgi:hypothetical protein